MADDKKTNYDYGFTKAFLAAAPSVAALIEKAKKQDWSETRFANALKDTAWWKQNSEAVRAWDTLRTTDPATFNQRVTQRREELQQRFSSIGGKVGPGELDRIARESLKYGWNEQQLQNAMVAYVDFSSTGGGAAYDLMAKYKEMARQNGITLSDQWIQNSAKSVIGGDSTTERIESSIRNTAASAFPAFAEQIRAGQSVAEIASPYVQSMAQLLELNPNDIDVADNKLRSALQATDDKGKPMPKSLFQFEKELKRDPRWMETKNARESFATAGRQILADFGIGW